AVEQDAAPFQIQRLKADVELAQVVLERAAEAAYASDVRRAHERLAKFGLDRMLGRVVKLETVGTEELDAVVLVGIMRGGYHRCEVQLVPAKKKRRSRRRQHSSDQCVPPTGAHTRGERRLEHLAGLARVAHDQHLGPPGLAVGDGGPA